jgi:8-oxo-dGTP pyrophosphatase MutT (NUDIX family)
VLDDYDRAFPGTEYLTNGLRRLVREHQEDAVKRTTWDGHITAGAVLRRSDGEVLLIHHRALDKWLLPGGHVEPGDASLIDAARRELAEETGIVVDGLEPLADFPVEINRHVIPANPKKPEPEHEHWDFRFAFAHVSPLIAERLHALATPA